MPAHQNPTAAMGPLGSGVRKPRRPFAPFRRRKGARRRQDKATNATRGTWNETIPFPSSAPSGGTFPRGRLEHPQKTQKSTPEGVASCPHIGPYRSLEITWRPSKISSSTSLVYIASPPFRWNQHTPHRRGRQRGRGKGFVKIAAGRGNPPGRQPVTAAFSAAKR